MSVGKLQLNNIPAPSTFLTHDAVVYNSVALCPLDTTSVRLSERLSLPNDRRKKKICDGWRDA